MKRARLWQTPVGGHVVFVLDVTPTSMLANVTAYDATGGVIGGSGVDISVEAEVRLTSEQIQTLSATWANFVGAAMPSPEVLGGRMYAACSLGVWEADVATTLARAYLDEDGVAVNDATVGGAAAALWLMAVEVCRDAFPPEAIEAGPPGN